ncbi:MAG: sulfate/molybdate ABC transporter ATP-binding protein [Deltaproteobacteria bacterium]|nr:sulfate/molybdate ABC transporter ATP-binding protein [Deltaproteobacteria bacterium]
MSVVVSQLTKRFTTSGTPAVSEVTFSAPTGAITTLLGPSGSGKSTVLRIVAGLEEPDDGQVFLDDNDCTYMPVQKRGVGFVFQSYALFKHMTVRENIAFGLKIRSVPRAEASARVDELLSLVQLEGLGHRFPAQLSGGQRQRVAFARALAIKPGVLLLDEPFGALDARVRLELRDWLRRFHETAHVTTLLVTHDQEEAMELSEHVVVMHEGRVEQAGSPHEIYDNPATPFVASFVGGGSVLKGRVSAGRAELGTLAVAAPEGAKDGAAVHAFVRPHDVKLARPGEEALEERISMAKIERLTRIGGQIKLALRLPDGEPMTVQVPKPVFDELGVAEGDRVMVDLREAKVFVEDYSI